MLVQPDHVLACLRGAPLFSGLESAQLLELLPHLSLVKMGPDTTLFTEGDQGDALYVVLTGRVSIRRDLKSGAFHELAELGDGAVFGEMAILDGSERMAGAVAVAETIVAVLPRSTFERLAAEHAPLVQPLLRSMSTTLCSRLRELTQVLQGMVDFEEEAPGMEGLADALRQNLVWN